ncbi:DUF4112 domain-containing protein [Roseibacterium sp. SDUM158017]|uniref:DUF4112 domain-containing protein n=1 Tax=Roseicyclus salinarum TaxID=3036773 RepID=UPI0024157E39|nr:DUF4112 domain-containing protein [Roseibacterium sp. SDUM158017]MDG4648460.1 DUF4112 domain-containing protein [Roseibacterium sp. SDUM158017]
MTPEDRQLQKLERLAGQLDAAFRVPGTGIRIGYDSIVGLIPGVGDTLALLPAAYILNEARKLGASRGVLARMAGNTGIDWVIGAIPLVGDLFDVGWKANRRNVALLRQDLQRRGRLGHEKGADKRPPPDRASGRRPLEA